MGIGDYRQSGMENNPFLEIDIKPHWKCPLNVGYSVCPVQHTRYAEYVVTSCDMKEV
jgi:hypothetical protein